MSVSAATIMAVTSGLVTVLDMIDRMNRRFPSEAERDQYISDRNAVRESLMDVLDSLRGPQDAAGDDPSHGYQVPPAGSEAAGVASGESSAGGSTPSESGDSRD